MLAAGLLWSGIATAAPDESILGKAEGYPVCPRAEAYQTRCLVGTVSHFDEIFPARRVRRGNDVWPLARAESSPRLVYAYQGKSFDVEQYLSRNRTTGLVVVKDGRIVFERYQYDRQPTHRMSSYSMVKSIVAMLLGIALDEGKIRSLDDRADAYVPALAGTPYGETSLRHLLSMSSGMRFTENYRGSDDVATLIRLTVGQQSKGGVASVLPFREREHAPGEKFRYASSDTQVLALVLRAATGKTLSAYLSEKIWRPMGAEADASWAIDAAGYEIGFAYFNATLRDYARLGMLLAHDGARDGRQIIPAAWVRSATTPPAQHFGPGRIDRYFGYGYQTWLIPGRGRRFELRGLHGQMICVDPDSKTVVAHTAAREAVDDPGYVEGNMMCAGLLNQVAKWQDVS